MAAYPSLGNPIIRSGEDYRHSHFNSYMGIVRMKAGNYKDKIQPISMFRPRISKIRCHISAEPRNLRKPIG